MTMALAEAAHKEVGVTTQTVKTLFAGEVAVQKDQVIRLTEPLLGFEDIEQFVIYQTQDGPLFWLQDLHNPEASFCVLAPFAAGLDPDYAIGPQDIADLGGGALEDLVVYTLVVLDKDPAKIRTNLRAPILVNVATRLAKQVVFDDPALEMRFPFSEIEKRLKQDR